MIGIRTSALHEIDTDADGSWETRTRTEFLVDHRNHTGYQQVVRETHYDADSGLVTKTVDYSYGLDEISQNVTEYDSQGAVTSITLHFFGHDGTGSVRVLINETAGTAEIYHFDAYGNAIGFQPSVALTKLGYRGEAFNAQINLQYLRARWYDAITGRLNRRDRRVKKVIRAASSLAMGCCPCFRRDDCDRRSSCERCEGG